MFVLLCQYTEEEWYYKPNDTWFYATKISFGLCRSRVTKPLVTPTFYFDGNERQKDKEWLLEPTPGILSGF